MKGWMGRDGLVLVVTEGEADGMDLAGVLVVSGWAARANKGRGKIGDEMDG